MKFSQIGSGTGKNMFISILISVFVIAILVAAGPADAVLLKIKDLPNTAFRGDEVSFTLEVDIEPNERIPIKTLDLEIDGPKTNDTVTCLFYPNGTLLPAYASIFKCMSLTITNINMVDQDVGDLNAYDYNISNWRSFGYGYGFAYGYGSTGGELSYNITWDTLKYGNNNIYALDGVYKIRMSMHAENSGDNHTFYSDEKTIALIRKSGDKEICNPESAINTCSDRFTSTRVLPITCHVNDELNVTINIDVNDNDRPKFLMLKEYIPEGFTVTDADGGKFNTNTRIMSWFIAKSKLHDTEVEDTSFTYKLLPTENEEQYLFGTLRDAKELQRIEGDDYLNCMDNGVSGIDIDEDGSPVPLDCNDNNPLIFPGAEETCNGIDDDCDNSIDEGVMTECIDYATCDVILGCFECASPPPEICNGIDDDCDGYVDEGLDCEEEVEEEEDTPYAPLSVMRDLPDNAPEDATFQVTITVDINESNPPPFYFLKEYLPPGFEIVDPGDASYDSYERRLKWAVIESRHHDTHVTDAVHTYTARATTTGTHNFTGRFKTIKTDFEVKGDTQMDII